MQTTISSAAAVLSAPAASVRAVSPTGQVCSFLTTGQTICAEVATLGWSGSNPSHEHSARRHQSAALHAAAAAADRSRAQGDGEHRAAADGPARHRRRAAWLSRLIPLTAPGTAENCVHDKTPTDVLVS